MTALGGSKDDVFNLMQEDFNKDKKTPPGSPLEKPKKCPQNPWGIDHFLRQQKRKKK